MYGGTGSSFPNSMASTRFSSTRNDRKRLVMKPGPVTICDTQHAKEVPRKGQRRRRTCSYPDTRTHLQNKALYDRNRN